MKKYLVGGAVRDELLGVQSKDRDYVVVGSTPDEMLAAGFSQVGADFPVFLHPATGEEYALARTERKNGVGYHGFDVEFDVSVTLQDDLSRRDLTMNSIAKDLETGEIIDPFNGVKDLENRILRHTSLAFAEDPLRVVRLARFYARYNTFAVAPDTMTLATKVVKSGELNHLPNERFWGELEKVFTEEQPQRFFDVLENVAFWKHITFFAELYNCETLQERSFIRDAAKIVAADISVPGAEKLMLHTAVTAKCGATLESASSRTKVLQMNVQTLCKTDRTAESIFELLRRTKAWSDGDTFNDVLSALGVMQELEKTSPYARILRTNIDLQDLHNVQVVTSRIKSEPFQHLQGKQIGEAMKAARIEAIKLELNL